MDWGSLGGILTGVLTITTIIIGGLLGLQAGTMKNVQTRADENAKAASDLRGRIMDLEKEIAELRADAAELHHENDLLKRLNSQSVNWTAVTDLIDHHHKAAIAHWDRLHGEVKEFRAELAAIMTALGGRDRDA